MIRLSKFFVAMFTMALVSNVIHYVFSQVQQTTIVDTTMAKSDSSSNEKHDQTKFAPAKTDLDFFGLGHLISVAVLALSALIVTLLMCCGILLVRWTPMTDLMAGSVGVTTKQPTVVKQMSVMSLPHLAGGMPGGITSPAGSAASSAYSDDASAFDDGSSAVN